MRQILRAQESEREHQPQRRRVYMQPDPWLRGEEHLREDRQSPAGVLRVCAVEIHCVFAWHASAARRGIESSTCRRAPIRERGGACACRELLGYS